MADKRNLDQLKQQQRLLQLFVFSLVTIMIWIGLSLFRSQNQTQIDAELRRFALPLTPTINTDVINELQAKTYFSEAELADFPIYKFLTVEGSNTEQVVTIDTEPETEAAEASQPSLAADQPAPLSQLSADQPATESGTTVEAASADVEDSGTQTPLDLESSNGGEAPSGSEQDTGSQPANI